MLIASLLGGELQEPRLRLGVRQAAERAEPALGLAQRAVVERLGAVEDPLVDASVLTDGEDHHGRPHVDQLQPHDRLLGRRRRHGETGVLRQAREQLHAPLQDLFEVEDRLGEVARDRAALRVAEPAAGRERVHVVAVADVGGDPSGAGVRVGEVAELLERRHLVADRGAGHADPGSLGDRLAAHGLAAAHVLLHDRHAGPPTCADRARPVRP